MYSTCRRVRLGTRTKHTGAGRALVGDSRQPLETVRDTSFRDRYFRGRARKELVGGAVLFICGLILAAIDFHRDLQWIWGYVLGLKCIVVGTCLIVAGAIGLRKELPGDNRQRI